jgi:hypothetical protein
MERSMKVLLIWMASAALIVVCWLFLPHDAFFSGESGVKLIQVENLIAKRYSDITLEYRGMDIDPRSEVSPFRLEPNLFIKDGKNYSVFPVLFPFLSSFFYSAAGWNGLYVLPMLSAMGILILVYVIARRFMTLSYAVACMLAAVFATPLVFYALTFWEHTIAVFLVMLSIALFLRGGKTVAAGIVGGTAVWFRSETVILFASMLLCGLLFMKRRRAVTLYSAASFAPLPVLLVFNKMAYGEWFGHVTRNIKASASGNLGVVIGEKTANLWRSLVGLNMPQRLPQESAGWGNSLALVRSNTVLEIACFAAIIFLALCALGTRRQMENARRNMQGGRRTFGMKAVFIASCVLICADAAYIGSFFLDRSPLITILASGGVFSFSPFLAAAFLVPLAQFRDAEERGVANWLVGSSTLFIVVASILAPNDGGLRYGARYLLPAMPILAVASFIALGAVSKHRFGRAFKYAFILMVVCSLAIEARGYELLRLKKTINRRFTQALLENPGDRVVMETWWMIFDSAPVALSKKVHILRDTRALAGIIARSRRAGERYLTLSLLKRDGITPDDRLGRFLSAQHARVLEVKQLVSPRCTYFNFTILTLELEDE